MAQASIPVDLFNPGQVFACMGFLEAADVLLGNAEGGFDWDNGAQSRFELHADGPKNPFEEVLEFVIGAQIQQLVPKGYKEELAEGPACTIETFPASKGDPMALPVRLQGYGRSLVLTHWCDASSRNSFKLFAGQQRSGVIVRQMISAIRQLWEKRKADLICAPFELTVPLGGSSFKFDARKAWTAIDAGYSPDEQTHAVEASPAVELLAAAGLEHTRPEELEPREVRYGVWRGLLPAVLARPALAAIGLGVPVRVFRFTLELSGKNKVVTFSREETNV